MIQMVLLGLLVVFVGAVAYQWEQFNRGRRIDDGLEPPARSAASCRSTSGTSTS